MAKAATPTATKAKPNFGSILDAAPTEVNKPKPYPVGSYFGVVQGQPRYDKSSKKQTEFVEFTIKFTGIGEDVDEDELKTCLGDSKLENKTIKATYYLTDDAIWRLDEFHENCGIDLSVEASRRERNEECVNSAIGFYINHEPSQNGEDVFARFGKTFAVET